jgi:hypothetical protein
MFTNIYIYIYIFFSVLVFAILIDNRYSYIIAVIDGFEIHLLLISWA